MTGVDTPPTPAVTVSAAVVILAGAALAVLRHLGSAPVEPPIATAAFGALFWAPAALALIGDRTGRPWLTVAAGMALMPLSLIAFSGVTLPLLIPAFVIVRAGIRASVHWTLATFSVALVSSLVMVASVVVLLFGQQDPASWQYADGSGGSTSDIITTAEAARTLALLGALVVLAPLAVTPRRPPALRPAPADGRPRPGAT